MIAQSHRIFAIRFCTDTNGNSIFARSRSVLSSGIGTEILYSRFCLIQAQSRIHIF